jgi:NADH dehydrogenase
LKREKDVEVLLVNRENFFSFTPMLYEVAASDLDVTHIVNPVRKMLAGIKFFLGDVQRIDLEARTVTVSHGSDDHSHALPYDQLVLSLGCTTNFYGLPGLEENALGMKSLGDAVMLRNRLIESLEEADTECAAKAGLRQPLLTCVVAGGGFAGVETLASINDFVREALPFYPHLREADLRMVLVHSGDSILPELDPRLGRYAQAKLEKRGVEFHLGTRVLGVKDEGVELSDGSVIPTRKPYPPTAQHAIRQGKLLAENIVASLRGRRAKPFTFKTIGQLATIGRRAGVAQIFGLRFSGFAAWWLWRAIYLSKLPRTEKKLRVMLDWTLDLFFSKDLVQYTTTRSR